VQRSVDDPAETGARDGPSFRGELAATAASAAAAYGYTISLGGSIALAVGRLGAPNLGEILLLMAGAVAGFVALEGLAHGTLVPTTTARDRPPSIWGNAHVPAAGSALCLVWALLELDHGFMLWLAVGFVCTSVYFLGTVLQRIALRRLVGLRRRGGPRER
jgi:hypothetical protein